MARIKDLVIVFTLLLYLIFSSYDLEVKAVSFIPRETAPQTDDVHYTSSNVFYNSRLPMPNCTTYAWGRAYEIIGKRPSLSTGMARRWFDENLRTKAYKSGLTPRVGSIACWGNESDSSYLGHVAVVERINANGTITLSESSYSDIYFRTRNVDPNAMENANDKNFRGYIYLLGDTTPPTITNVKVSNVTNEGYTVSCDVTDNEGIDSVMFPTWTVNNGQDDLIWHRGENKGNNKYSFEVKITDHKNEFGEYITHIYAYDNAGNEAFKDIRVLIESKKEYSISYDLSGGTCKNLEPKKYKSETSKTQSIQLPTPTKSGYVFQGWKDEAGNVYKSLPIGSIGDKKITAVWEQQITVYYHDSLPWRLSVPSSFKVPQTIISGKKAEQLKSAKDCGFVNSGFKCVGWTKEKDGKGKLFTEGQTVSLSEIAISGKNEVNLYAKWEPLPSLSYKVVCALNDGTRNIHDSFTYTAKNKNIALSDKVKDPKREGYVFEGWYSKRDGGKRVKTINTSAKSDVVVYAHWKDLEKKENSGNKKDEYTVRFHGNTADAGSVSDVKKIKNEFWHIPMNKYTKQGATFVEWNTKADGSGISYAQDAYVVNLAEPGGVLDLYARWSNGKYDNSSSQAAASNIVDVGDYELIYNSSRSDVYLIAREKSVISHYMGAGYQFMEEIPMGTRLNPSSNAKFSIHSGSFYIEYKDVDGSNSGYDLHKSEPAMYGYVVSPGEKLIIDNKVFTNKSPEHGEVWVRKQTSDDAVVKRTSTSSWWHTYMPRLYPKPTVKERDEEAGFDGYFYLNSMQKHEYAVSKGTIKIFTKWEDKDKIVWTKGR